MATKTRKHGAKSAVKTEPQAVEALREFDMILEYYAGTITRRVEIVDRDTSAGELIAMISEPKDVRIAEDIDNVFVKRGNFARVIDGKRKVLAKFRTIKKYEFAQAETYGFYDPSSGEEIAE